MTAVPKVQQDKRKQQKQKEEEISNDHA